MKEEQDSYQTAQVSHGDRKRKARLVKMVATTQLRLTLEAEDERSAKKWNGLDWI